MAKEAALRFMMIVEKDKEIKNAFNSIMNKYEETNLSNEEWDKVIQNEVIPFAKKYGYDFTPEDLAELQKMADGEISDEELNQVVGGRGQYSETVTALTRGGTSIVTYTKACDFASDDQTFIAFMDGKIDCPDYVWKGRGASNRSCLCCAHYQSYRSKFKPRLDEFLQRD
jgi:hypothetical protein